MSGVQVPPPLLDIHIVMKFIYSLFFKHISDHNLIQAGDTIIAAFSGGKDSLTLLHLLKRLKQDIPIQLIAAYFNHRIRKDHLEEQQFVEKICGSMNIQLIVKSENVTAFQEKNSLNLEHAASLLRYRFLTKVSRNHQSPKIATGHTRSDLAETFLIKLMRGSGSRGLSAIFIQKGSHIIRPLLVFSSLEIRAFLDRNHIRFYRDYTNRDNTLLRNRIRNILLPAMKKIEPKIEEHIFNTATIIQDEHDYLTNQSQDFLKKNLILNQVLSLDLLKKCPIALQRFVLREYIKRIKGDLLNINFSHIENMLKNSSCQKSSFIPGLALQCRKGYLYPEKFVIPPYSYDMASPGVIPLREIEKKIEVKIIKTFRTPKNNFEIVTPQSSIQFPLQVRSSRRSDKYIKINSGINQRVYEMIRSSGMPADLRNYYPLLLDATGKPIWVAGSPIADAFKVKSKKETRFIKISYY